jgi:hypothetical protein
MGFKMPGFSPFNKGKAYSTAKTHLNSNPNLGNTGNPDPMSSDEKRYRQMLRDGKINQDVFDQLISKLNTPGKEVVSEVKAPTTKSPYPIAPEDEIMTNKPTKKLTSKLTVKRDKSTVTNPDTKTIKSDMDAVNVSAKKGKGSKKKKDDKTIAKSEYNIAKVKHSQGKISDEELAASKEKKKKSQTGREKIRMKTKKIKSDVTKKIKDTKKKFTKSDEEKELKKKQKLAKLKRKNPKKYAKLEQASKTISGV